MSLNLTNFQAAKLPKCKWQAQPPPKLPSSPSTCKESPGRAPPPGDKVGEDMHRTRECRLYWFITVWLCPGISYFVDRRNSLWTQVFCKPIGKSTHKEASFAPSLSGKTLYPGIRANSVSGHPGNKSYPGDVVRIWRGCIRARKSIRVSGKHSYPGIRAKTCIRASGQKQVSGHRSSIRAETSNRDRAES